MADKTPRLFPTDLILSSSNRTSGTLDRPSFLLLPAIHNPVAYSINWMVVPFSYYIIDHSNNKIIMEQKQTANNVDSWWVFELVLKPGTYTSDNFQDEFKRATQQTSSTTFWTLTNGVKTYGTVQQPVYPEAPGKFGFFVEKDSARSVFYHETNQFTLKFVNNWEIFGYMNDETVTTQSTVIYKDGSLLLAGAQLFGIRSPNVVRLLGPTTLTLHSNLPLPQYSRGVNDGQQKMTMTVPVSGNFGSYMTFAGTGEQIPCSGDEHVTDAEFWLTLGNKKTYYEYESNSPVQSPVSTSDQLPLNGEQFTVSIRFYHYV